MILLFSKWTHLHINIKFGTNCIIFGMLDATKKGCQFWKKLYSSSLPCLQNLYKMSKTIGNERKLIVW